MAESKIRDDNYYQVSGWMLNRLGLKGTALQVYAIIYGFSQDGESSFTGSLQYLSDFTNSTKQTVCKILKDLTERELLRKTESLVNGVKFNTYQVNLQVLKKLEYPIQETLTGGIQKSLTGGSQKTLTNNKGFNNKPSDNKGDKKETPTADYSQTTFSEAMKAKVDQWLQYKSERKEDYQPTGLQSLITQIQNNVNKHGEDAIIDLIGDCMANGYRGIIWDRLKPKQATGGRKEPEPAWMKDDRPRPNVEDKWAAREAAWNAAQKTAGNDPELAARADALRQRFQGANTP